MRSWIVGLAVGLAVGPVGAAAQDEADGRRWLDGLMAVMAEDATPADVDAMLSMYHPDAVYEHPAVGAKVEGLEAIRAGRTHFLGRTRNPRATEVDMIVGSGVVVVSYRLTVEARGADGGWSPGDRRNVVVLEFSDGRIVRVIDH